MFFFCFLFARDAHDNDIVAEYAGWSLHWHSLNFDPKNRMADKEGKDNATSNRQDIN